MSIETRSNSAPFKRAEQLKRWEESDTNREPVTDKHRSCKIKFSSGCVFLAACAASEKEEVLSLLEKGADIDTPNVDGLTALHQACIDDNLDMVEFLVEHGADVNRGDNEGWTPLHATVSCGFVSIAKYLLEHGANVAAVNCDGELALDIAEDEEMEELIQTEIDSRGIDCEEARNDEKRLMLRDAKEWLASKSPCVDMQNPRTGATPLHVASAKGYIDVIRILLQCGADVDKQDNDGWTPLHAAAHWSQKDSAQLLVENYSDMDSKNFVGQTPFDVADSEIFRYLEVLKRKQNKEEVLNRRKAKYKQEAQDKSPDNEENQETPKKIKMELEIREEDKLNADSIEMDVSSESEPESSEDSETEAEESSTDEKKNRVNSNMDAVVAENEKENSEESHKVPSSPNKQLLNNAEDVNITTTEDNKPTWRRPVPTKQAKTETTTQSQTIKSSNSFKSKDMNNENDVQLRRTNSFQNDPDASKDDKADKESTTMQSATNSPNKTTSASSPATSPLPNSQPVRRSFVPPVRDEESETQRKAHAKRVRETRRSTQGVTLEEIKSAEQFVKKINNQSSTVNNNNNEQPNGANGVSVSATITTASPTVPTKDAESVNSSEESVPPPATQERRPSWRLRVDNGSKFKLEDANKVAEPPSSTPSSFTRKPPNTTTSNTTTTTTSTTTTTITARPSSAPVDSTADTTTVTLPLRRQIKSLDDKEQDKENDIRNAQATLATQAAIQRRRRPKRRSTGVVAFDNNDEFEIEKDNSGGGDCEEIIVKQNHQESGNEKSSTVPNRTSSRNEVIRDENGDIDYKKLYEQALSENDRLKDKVRKTDEELRDTKQTLEKLNTLASKNPLSELEKRERRAMERKLSEMEEELKQLQKLKAENERLRAENRALTRVVSKLSNSAAK